MCWVGEWVRGIREGEMEKGIEGGMQRGMEGGRDQKIEQKGRKGEGRDGWYSLIYWIICLSRNCQVFSTIDL